MKVNYRPDGGKYGYGFNYFCVVCGIQLGNSSDDELSHPATELKGWFKTGPIDCPHVGETYEVPLHQIEVVAIPRKPAP